MAAALQALLGVYERGGFTRPASSQAALAEWFKDSDQVALFVEDVCLMGPSYGPTHHKVLFEAFQAWCSSQNIRHSVTGRTFSARLANLGAIPTDGKIRFNQDRGVGFYGIELG
jgi:phage/plasmid-associated DNA primase